MHKYFALAGYVHGKKISGCSAPYVAVSVLDCRNCSRPAFSDLLADQDYFRITRCKLSGARKMISMKICKLIVSLMLVFAMLCSITVADSLVSDAMLKVSDASDEWQIIYLACYTADGMTRYGYIQNNWAKLKAVCSGVEFPTTLSYELVTAEEDEEMVALRF